ncbi:hypothetical protein [Arvimicrobium flavum]|uniref:hypothetical protein n=1 Tax=Arvimicrobium flavum TaxID=3393320 RepID=UPI00237C3FDE|nr:hypothetical protein [Mesorhizobium shangrilense]
MSTLTRTDGRAGAGLLGRLTNWRGSASAARGANREFASFEVMDDHLLRDVGLRRPLSTGQRGHMVRF